MTEPQKRVVTGLTRRPPAVTGDLSRLQRKNRTPVPTSSEPPADDAATAGREDGSNEPKSTKRITVYIDQGVFARARGVHRATSHLDGDKSWSEFVQKALLREAEARERAHNGGQRYGDSNAQLTAGRPLSD